MKLHGVEVRNLTKREISETLATDTMAIDTVDFPFQKFAELPLVGGVATLHAPEGEHEPIRLLCSYNGPGGYDPKNCYQFTDEATTWVDACQVVVNMMKEES